ncbi:mechanosensitive ion channel domain-containing protein [Sphingomonas sp.]|uniref:mechanosensitive ion channel family protein n=1 Tax=Sphingomonas sp. TaxID=28214 RepID=UPI0025EA0F40|nr:mechanosensitive ion channel domain-containing protein [Sphingomonas sp.]
MQDLAQWLAGNGMAMPSQGEIIQAAVAYALAAVALAAGWLAGDRLGHPLSAAWEKHVGASAEGLAPRMCKISQHGTAAILLALVFNAQSWQPLAAFGLGLALGVSVALLVKAVLRGLHLPVWAAWSMAALAFTAILSRAMHGLDSIRNTLGRVGFTVGMREVSLLNVLTFLITAVILFAAVRLINRVVAHLIRRSKTFDPTQKLLFEKLAGIAVVVVAFFVGIDLLRIDLTAFTVFTGAFGLAVGFGMQKTIGNLIAGIILLMDRSVKPGDVIVVGDSFGWVNKIGVRAVSVVTRDGKEHLIPNEDLMTREVENWSYTDRNVRVRVPVTVAYSCDLKLAQSLMLQAAKDSPRVLDTPKSNVWLTAFGQTGVEHEILVWISDPESGVGNVKSDVLNRLWLLFKEHGIEVPYPVRDIRVREWPGAAPEGTKD